MIDELNVNQKVGQIFIKISNENPIDIEIIRMMINNKYHNLYWIWILDCNNSMDNNIHDAIK